MKVLPLFSQICFTGKAEEDIPRNAPAETHEKEKLSPSSCVSGKALLRKGRS